MYICICITIYSADNVFFVLFTSILYCILHTSTHTHTHAYTTSLHCRADVAYCITQQVHFFFFFSSMTTCEADCGPGIT